MIIVAGVIWFPFFKAYDNQLYKKEQESYLKNIYGEEQFNLLHELKVYRKLKIITLYYKGFCYMMGHLSQHNFSRLLMIKRFVRRILGISVN